MERIPILRELEIMGIGVVEEGGCEVDIALVREYPRNVRDVLEGIARETGYNPIVHFQVRIGDRYVCIGGPPIEGKALVVKTTVPDIEKVIAWAAILYHRVGVPVVHMNLLLLAESCRKYKGLLAEYGVQCEIALSPAGKDDVEDELGGSAMPHRVSEPRELRRSLLSPGNGNVGAVSLNDDVGPPYMGEEYRMLVLAVRDMAPLDIREIAALIPTLKRYKVRELVRAAADAPDHAVEQAINLLRGYER